MIGEQNKIYSSIVSQKIACTKLYIYFTTFDLRWANRKKFCNRKCHNLNSLSLVLLVKLHQWDEAWKKVSHVIYFQIFYRIAII